MKQTRVKVKRLTVLVCASLAAIMFACAWLIGFVAAAHADETSSLRRWSESVSVSNASFSESGSGNPASPSSWTETVLNSGSYVKGGVVNVDTYRGLSTESKKDYDFPSSAAIDTPQKGGDYKDTDKNVLFVNAKTPAAYGYASGEITLEKSAYYRIRAYVKTYVDSGKGASLSVSGFGDKRVGIVGIDTKGEWRHYSLFVSTSSLASSTAKIELGLGSEKAGDQCTGAAFFDSVTVTRISAYTFNNASGKANADNVIDLSGSEYTSAIVSLDETDDILLGGLDSAIDSTSSAGLSVAEIRTIAGDGGINGYGFDSAVYPAFDGKTPSVLVLATPYDSTKEKYGEGYASARTAEFTVARSAYYRISGWYYAEGFDQGEPSVKLEYKSAASKPEDKYEFDKSVSLSASSSSKDHNGWQEFTVFVKGSDVGDLKARLVLSAGDSDSHAKGAVMFEELRIRQLTPARYNELSSSATGTVTPDTEVSTGITNGSFDAVGTYESLDDLTSGKPLVPANWTKTVTAGKDNEVSGLVDYATVAYPDGIYDKRAGNILKISGTDAVVSYKSDTFSVSADGYSLISVDVIANDVTGYGATIFVKRDGNPIGSIEKIKKSGRYNFYVKSGSAASTLTLELGLGKADKPASGTVYFTRAGLLTSAGSVLTNHDNVALAFAATADEFNEKSATYNSLRLNSDVDVKNAAISLGTEDMTLFDSYGEADLKTPYNWTLTTTDTNNTFCGVFDSKNRGGKDIKNVGNMPEGFKPYGDAYPYALVLRNGEKAYSYLTLDNAYTIAADSYYKITFAVKTYGIESEKGGAFVSIGDDYKFNFTSTVRLIDGLKGNVKDYGDEFKNYENYDTYVFYVKSGSSETKSNITFGLGGDKTKQHARGTVVLGYINLEKIESIDYEEATSDLKDDENKIDDFTMRANFAAAKEEDSTENTQKGEIAWWLIPSILLGVAVVIAVIGTFIRKKIENRPKKPVNPTTRSSYDRRNLNLPENENPDANGNVSDEPTEEPVTEPVEETAETAGTIENAEETTAEPTATEPETATEETVEGTPAETAAPVEESAPAVEAAPAKQPTEENK